MAVKMAPREWKTHAFLQSPSFCRSPRPHPREQFPGGDERVRQWAVFSHQEWLFSVLEANAGVWGKPARRRITKPIMLKKKRLPYLAVIFYNNSNHVNLGEEYVLPNVFVKITFTSHTMSQRQMISSESTCESKSSELLNAHLINAVKCLRGFHGDLY